MADKVAETQAVDEQEESYDTSNPQQVNTARKKAARTKADRLRFVQAAMQTVEGRGWFHDILVRCHITRNPYMAGDPQATAFRCGEQNIGLQILDDIQTAAPQLYIDMITENKEFSK